MFKTLSRLISISALAVVISLTASLVHAAPSYPGESRLTVGQVNSDVKAMQQAMIKLGYAIPAATGRYGPATQAAVVDFYARRNQVVDGRTMGPAGWDLLHRQATNTAAPKTSSEQRAKVGGTESRARAGKQPSRGTHTRSLPYRMPVMGEVTATYMQRGRRWHGGGHMGIDVRAPRGTNIRAVLGGEVVEAGYSRGYGRLVAIKHEDGSVAIYAHMTKIGAKKGKQVSTNDVIGTVGSTGNASGSHVHFEVRDENQNLKDPVAWLKANAKK
jgi:murein DD-endopeptidase MepM/ murein hydrolase activator NlpD